MPTAWATDLEFAYDHGHLYVLDAARHWSDGGEGLMDVTMPRGENFFVPLRVEGLATRPPPDFDAWDQVIEFSLPVPTGKLALASGGCGAVTLGIAPGDYRARWSGRNLSAAAAWAPADDDDEANAPDAYRLQLWPGPALVPRAELKRWTPPGPRSDLGDVPALLDDRQLDATGTIIQTEVTTDGLLLHLRLEAWPQGPWRRMIRCDGVVRWLASSEPFDRAVLRVEHPGLLPYADEQGGLSFRGRPEYPGRLASALRAEHADAAGRHVAFERVFQADFNGALAERLSIGYGRLASGPVTLLRRYAGVAQAHGVATHLSVSGPGRAGLSLLELGDSYVVAERFSAR